MSDCIFKEDGFTCSEKEMSYTCSNCLKGATTYTTEQTIKARAYIKLLSDDNFDFKNKSHHDLCAYIHKNNVKIEDF